MKRAGSAPNVLLSPSIQSEDLDTSEIFHFELRCARWWYCHCQSIWAWRSWDFWQKKKLPEVDGILEYCTVLSRRNQIYLRKRTGCKLKEVPDILSVWRDLESYGLEIAQLLVEGEIPAWEVSFYDWNSKRTERGKTFTIYSDSPRLVTELHWFGALLLPVYDSIEGNEEKRIVFLG
jgi:hypothetical protein